MSKPVGAGVGLGVGEGLGAGDGAGPLLGGGAEPEPSPQLTSANAASAIIELCDFIFPSQGPAMQDHITQAKVGQSAHACIRFHQANFKESRPELSRHEESFVVCIPGDPIKHSIAIPHQY